MLYKETDIVCAATSKTKTFEMFFFIVYILNKVSLLTFYVYENVKLNFYHIFPTL